MAADPWTDPEPDPGDERRTFDPDPTAEPGGALHQQLLKRADLADLPVPEPLIENTLDRRTVALLAGYHGTGKSFVAQSWAACVATGHTWLSRDISLDGGQVLYVAAEGAYGLHPRLASWEAAWRTRITGQALAVLPRPVNLGRHFEVADLIDLCDYLTPALVVLDTLARCTVGLDENSAQDMGRVVDALYRIRDACEPAGGTVLVVHHTGKDKATVRGSSALEAGVDTVYKLDADGPALTLERTKRKDGPTPDLLRLRLDPHPGQSAPILVRGGADTTDSVRSLMSAFMSAFAATGASKADLRSVASMPAASFHRALGTAVTEGFLVQSGSDARPFYRLGDWS